MLETPFTCPKGHNFTANAKLRARCPNCGALARRSFQATTAEPVEEPKEDQPQVVPPAPAIKKPVLLRQGREMPRKAAPKTPAKPATTAQKKVAKKPVAKVSGGLVTANRVRRGITPTIKRAPKRTAPARHVVGQSSNKGVTGYLQDMMRKAGFGG